MIVVKNVKRNLDIPHLINVIPNVLRSRDPITLHCYFSLNVSFPYILFCVLQKKNWSVFVFLSPLSLNQGIQYYPIHYDLYIRAVCTGECPSMACD